MARCGPKHIFKSKSTKHHIPGLIFEVPRSKNGTPLWRAAHLQVNTQNTTCAGQVPMSKNGTPLWREAHLQVKKYKTPQVHSDF